MSEIYTRIVSVERGGQQNKIQWLVSEEGFVIAAYNEGAGNVVIDSDIARGDNVIVELQGESSKYQEVKIGEPTKYLINAARVIKVRTAK